MGGNSVLRKINGVIYRCWDIGCPNFDRAEENREMVSKKEHITGYIEIEEAVAHTPLNQSLPSWIPVGVLPSALEHEVFSHSGGHTEEIITTVDNLTDTGGGGV